MKKKEEEKERRELLLQAYRDNAAFINKAIFTISVGAIIFFSKTYQSSNDDIYIIPLASIPLSFFLVTLALHILGLRSAKAACNDALSSDEQIRDRGWKTIKTGIKRLDNLRDILFLVSMLFGIIVIILK